MSRHIVAGLVAAVLLSLAGCHADRSSSVPPTPTPSVAAAVPSGSPAPVGPKGDSSATAPAAPSGDVVIGRFSMAVPSDFKLVKIDDGDRSTRATFDRGGAVLLVELVKNHPGEFCERILAADRKLFTSERVPGADHLETPLVGGRPALFAVGRAEAPVAGVKFVGAARAEICVPDEVNADLTLSLPEREISAADREAFLAMAASLRRRPVSDEPSEQCIEKEAPVACKTACNAGHADSCAKLGYLTVKTNRPAAVELFKRACSGGSDKGCRALQILAR